MIKIKKHLVFLVLFLFIASVLFWQIFTKYFPFLLRTPVYYCQHFWCSTLIKISSLLGTTLFKILLVTIFITFIKTVLSFYKISSLRRSLLPIKTRSAKLKKVVEELKLTKRVVVVKHADPFSFCFGFLRSKIIVSDSLVKLLSEKELEAVLSHEKYHLVHLDALTMSVARFLQSLFPFFPLFKDQIVYLSLDREIKADRQAVLLLGDKEPLIRTLKKLLSYEVVPAYTTFPSFLNSDKNLEFRIKALIQKQISYQPYSSKNIVLSLGVLSVLLALVLLPVRTVQVNASSEKEVVACINNEACVQACIKEKQRNDSLFQKLHPGL